MTPNHQPSLGQRIFDALTIPWVDKIIAILAVLPFIYYLHEVVTRGQMSIPRAGVAINALILIVTMLFRTAPVRVTPNPWYWLLAFVASYQGLAFAAFGQHGVALVPNLVTDFLAVLSLAVVVYARYSLGRSIGLVPAQRVIMTRGAYGFVRHPIYTAAFIGYLGFALRVYTPRNATMVVIGAGLFVIKSFVEEWFLREDREYVDYVARVRWRWFPGLL
jgi:protein-S-isoprenylcysteine O-methyltransferase Ste14